MKLSENVLLGLKAVKDSNKADIFNYKEVYYYAIKMGFYETALWVKENKSNFVYHILQINWDKIPSIFEEDLL